MRCYRRFKTSNTRTISPMRLLEKRSKQPLENMTNPDFSQETETKVVWECRQNKWWEDNIKDLTGMDFASPTRAEEDKTR